MNIHEYQAKQLLKQYGVPVPEGVIALSADEVKRQVANLEKNGTKVFVVKAQIHAGGRGKAGGVKVVKTATEAISESEKMFGKVLVTKQTGAEGRMVRRVYVEEGSKIAKEYYLSFITNREKSCISIITSTEGGMEIEEVAHESPEKIITVDIDPIIGCEDFYVRQLVDGLKLGVEGKYFASVVKSLYKAFIATDAVQLEINPLVLTEEGQFICLDAKMGFDDNALYRQKAIIELRDKNEEDELEIKASEFGLSYIKMDGNIGCMVNGAGLAMATMDIIKACGGVPANFLDVGGGATKEKVTEAFKIIISDKAVKAVLVNIFGGIMRCDVIAEGILAAMKEVSLKIPLIVRLEGTNVDLGKKLIADSGLNVITADDLGDAAKKAVAALKGGRASL